jgi:flagellar protein FlbD
MIALHRLAHADEPFHLNPDLIFTVEAHPDTVVTLTTGTKVVIMESPDDVAVAIRQWRARSSTSRCGRCPAAPPA